MRILIIEDDETLLRLYRAQLSRWPFDVEIFSAPNGFEGLVMVGEVAPHLLICDLRLPGVNGFHIVRSLHNMPRYKSLKIVVVSGLPPEEIDANGGFYRDIELIMKPVDFKRLEKIATIRWQELVS